MNDRTRELYEAVAALAAAFPVPHPSWHGYVPQMRACVADLERALEVSERAPEVLALALRAVEGELEHDFDAHHAGPGLAAAYRRLGALPVPAGEHPFLDEIVPTLEAVEALPDAPASEATAPAPVART